MLARQSREKSARHARRERSTSSLRPLASLITGSLTAMAVRVLGCSGSIAAGSRTTSFLLDDTILFDAGTGVGDLSLEQLARIDHVLISHSHLDHIAALPLLADTVMRQRISQGRPPIRVHGLPQTLQALRDHIFNNVIWPDFTRLPTPQRPVLSLHAFELGQRLELPGCMVEVLPAEHTVPAVGFAVWRSGPGPGRRCWVFTGDTGPNPGLWARLAELEVGQLVIETAFADEEREIAERSGHLYPTRLCDELTRLNTSVQVFITHIKPGEHRAVMTAIGRGNRGHCVQALEAGQLIELG